ncbi:DUF4179 domain-containing protein [Saccharibacillus kuerlensis]|uniref:DUF4179 domain-containing protein n=1 Tax=Saccharibacillus kuerlensis TaxID=459527 RepID=A0ABQ2KWN6_9BACL|nr:DUF4179 domain-containing protein [Saccharibacillus kuerlensis]GGN94706.1 hypothetical protein GCM10010969_09630 [Saccharibacillus kuerlensis]
MKRPNNEHKTSMRDPEKENLKITRDPMTSLRQTDLIELPAAVETRIEDTFRIIRSGEASEKTNKESESTNRNRGRMSRLRRSAAITAASVLLLGAGLTGIGFASPSFAKAMQSVPILGGIFSMYGDHGLQTAEEEGFVQPSELTETIGDLTVGVRNVVFDGTRIALEVFREGEGPLYNDGDPNHPEHGIFENVSAFYGQQSLNPSYRAAGDGTVLMTMDYALGEALPDKFELSLSLELAGVDQPFEFEVPVESNTPKIVIEQPQMPKELIERGIFVDRVIVTPVTTQVVFHLRPRAEDTKGTFVHADDIEMSNIMHDELGSEYRSLSGMGEPESEAGSKQYYQFEPVNTQARTLKLGFDMPGEQDGKPYTHIEMEVLIPSDS